MKEKWTCEECGQKFLYANAQHSCNERSLEDFLNGKSELTQSLFWHFVNEYKKIGEIVLHPAKSRIAFASDIRFAYIHRLGKNYVDVVFMFNEAFHDNYCFYKIAQVPGAKQCNHYFRLERIEDLNDEVKGYMQLAYERSLRDKD